MAQEQGPKVGLPGWRPFAAGTLAGIGNVLIGHPLDTLKVRVQTAPVHNRIGPSLRGVYAGVAGPLVTLPFLAGVNFGIYDATRQQLTARWPALFARRGVVDERDLREPSSGLACVFLSGVTSGWVVCHVTCPMTNVKVQQQTSGVSLSLAQAVKRVGVRRLFRGYVPHAVMESVGRGWYMVGFVCSKRAFGIDSEPGQQGAELWKRIVCGSVGGASAWTMAYPADVVRNRIMHDWEGLRYRGCVDCARQTLSEGGIAGFYRGFSYTLIRAIPVAAVTLPIYDMALNYLNAAC